MDPLVSTGVQNDADRQLVESEHRYRTLFETMGQGVVYLDADGRITSANPAAERILGLSLEEMQGRASVDPRWHTIREDGSEFPGTEHPAMEALRTGRPVSGVTMGVYHPGDVGYRWIVIHAVPSVRPGESRPFQVCTTFADITDRKKAEEALRVSEENYRRLFEAESDAIVLIDNASGRILEANAAACTLYGYSRDELLQATNEDLSAEPARTRQVTVSTPPAADQVITIPLRWHRRRDGTTFPVEITGRFFTRAGRAVHIAAIRDISRRVAAEEALSQSERRLRFALEGANDGLWDRQMPAGTSYLSPRACEILGYEPGELDGSLEWWERLVHPDDLASTRATLEAHLSGRTPTFEVEQRLKTKSGAWKWVLARGKVVERDADGRPLRMTGTHTDISSQKHLEDQLRQAHKMESVGRLAGGVAHDFNNMLGVILGHTELALEQAAAGSALRADLEEIQKAGRRSADLTRQLLGFARRQTVAPKVLSLNETVEGMFKLLRRLIGEDVDLVWKPGRGLWDVRMDPAQVDQILANLSVNARDAIDEGGRVTIETANVTLSGGRGASAGVAPGDYVVLAVSDTGRGMSQDVLDRIFEPFFTTKEVGKGTGLGLATVYGIVKQNDGFVDVESEPGRGTTFRVFLPRARATMPETSGRAERKAMAGAETVLLVEDEVAILDLGKTMLERFGYTVLAARAPREALALAREYQGRIDLLITDVVMPEMNGRRLHEDLALVRPGVKVLFMSGYTASVIADNGVLDDGIQFLQKPFSTDMLARKVREVLDQDPD